MAPDPQAASAPPRRTLADLLPELKAIIVQMARDQDSALQHRINSTASTRELVSLGMSDWDGKSARALSLVDRAWNLAAAPVLFETITSTRCQDSLFGFRISAKYPFCVKKVIFLDVSKAADWRSLLRALPSFANLEHVTFTEEAVFTLFNPGGEPDEDQATFREALRTLAPRIPNLNLMFIDVAATSWMLPQFTTLRWLKWCPMESSVDASYRTLGQAFAQCRRLEHLSLIYPSNLLSSMLMKDAVEPSSWPGVRSLVITLNPQIGADTWRLIQSFGATLEKLLVYLSDASLLDHLGEEREASTFAFPNLRRLTIKSGSAAPVDTTPLLKIFSASPIGHLILPISGNGHDLSPTSLPSTDFLETVLRLFPTHLRSLQLDYHPLLNMQHFHSLAPALVSLASARNISLTLLPSYDIFLHRKQRNGDPGTRQEQTIRRCDGVDEVLRHTLAQSGRMRATGDLEGAEQLVEALTPLRGRMLRDED
ncbi:hypothetical protein BCR35DRAFT_303140 [Leucosporidium creatinivorum]|uniref:Uncharacterized protein n=1 Tax=Leucosporidium creatinivorum TaxID=106004 RepID=A0A1Y2FJH3_9BASI|nr:hypothetical protein BCR35DRAFT_303140 [Leucosporidium creatinivorum]